MQATGMATDSNHTSTSSHPVEAQVDSMPAAQSDPSALAANSVYSTPPAQPPSPPRAQVGPLPLASVDRKGQISLNNNDQTVKKTRRPPPRVDQNVRFAEQPDLKDLAMLRNHTHSLQLSTATSLLSSSGPPTDAGGAGDPPSVGRGNGPDGILPLACPSTQEPSSESKDNHTSSPSLVRGASVTEWSPDLKTSKPIILHTIYVFRGSHFQTFKLCYKDQWKDSHLLEEMRKTYNQLCSWRRWLSLKDVMYITFVLVSASVI